MNLYKIDFLGKINRNTSKINDLEFISFEKVNHSINKLDIREINKFLLFNNYTIFVNIDIENIKCNGNSLIYIDMKGCTEGFCKYYYICDIDHLSSLFLKPLILDEKIHRILN